jgi:hypothetical protein
MTHQRSNVSGGPGTAVQRDDKDARIWALL